MRFLWVLLQVVDIGLNILQWLIFLWVIVSWAVFLLHNSKFRWRNRRFYGILERLNEIFDKLTRPLLRPIRRWMRRFNTGAIDWSPMVLVLLIMVLRQVVRTIRYRLILNQVGSLQ